MAQRRQRPQDAGVADQDVELPPALVDGGPKRVDLVAVLEVEGEQRGVAAEVADLVVQLLQRAGGAPDQDQMRALLGVGQRHRPADAARGSGDEGEAAGEAWCGLMAVLLALAVQRWQAELEALRPAAAPALQSFFGGGSGRALSINSLPMRTASS